MPIAPMNYTQLPPYLARRRRFADDATDVDATDYPAAPSPPERAGPILRSAGGAGAVFPSLSQNNQTSLGQPALMVPQRSSTSINPDNQTSLPSSQSPLRTLLRIPTSLNQPGQSGAWSERLPDGRSVWEAVAGLPRKTETSLRGTPAMVPPSTSPRDIGTADTGVEGQIPLKPHHGFWDRLKSVGKGFLINAGQYAATHPDAGVGGLLGAGISGGVVGGVAPDRIDRQILDVRRAKEMSRRAQEAEIARVEAEAQRARQPQQLKPPETREVGGVIVERQEDGSWKPVFTAPAKPPAPTKKGVHVVGGRLVDDEGKVIYEAPTTPATSKPGGLTANQQQQYRNREADRQGKLDAATNEVKRLTAEEAEAAKKKDAAYEALHAATINPNTPKEDVAAAQAAADKAQAYYASFADKKREAQAKIEQYRTAEPAPTSSEPASTSNYSGRTMTKANLARYAKDHGLSIEDAQKQVEGMGVTIR